MFCLFKLNLHVFVIRDEREKKKYIGTCLVLVGSQGPHFTIGAPIVQSHCSQIIKCLLKIGFHFGLDENVLAANKGNGR